MTTNIWIYFSCLLFCVAIEYSFWKQHDLSMLHKKKEKVDAYLLDHLKGVYSNISYYLMDNCKRKRSLSEYRDSLAIIQYLVDNNEVVALKNKWIALGVGYKDIMKRDLLDEEISIYRYANDIIGSYIEITKPKDFFSSTTVDIELNDLGEGDKRVGELKLDFYRDVDDNVELVYVSDGKILETINGSARTKEPLGSLNAIMLDGVTGETKTYRFYEID